MKKQITEAQAVAEAAHVSVARSSVLEARKAADQDFCIRIPEIEWKLVALFDIMPTNPFKLLAFIFVNIEFQRWIRSDSCSDIRNRKAGTKVLSIVDCSDSN